MSTKEKEIIQCLKELAEVMYDESLHPRVPKSKPDRIFRFRNKVRRYYTIKSAKINGLKFKLMRMSGVGVRQFLLLTLVNEKDRKLIAENENPGKTILTGYGFPPRYYWDYPTLNIRIAKTSYRELPRNKAQARKKFERVKMVLHPLLIQNEGFTSLDFLVSLEMYLAQAGFLSTETIYKDFADYYFSKFDGVLEMQMNDPVDRPPKKQDEVTVNVGSKATRVQPNPMRYKRYSIPDWVIRRHKGGSVGSRYSGRLVKADLVILATEEILQASLKAIVKNFTVPITPGSFRDYVLKTVKDRIKGKHCPGKSQRKPKTPDTEILDTVSEMYTRGYRIVGSKFTQTGNEEVTPEAGKKAIKRLLETMSLEELIFLWS